MFPERDTPAFLASSDVEINPRFYRGKRKSFSEDKNGELEASRKLHGIMKAVWHRKTMEEKMKDKNEIKSTAHSKYRCQYHLVFAPKFRRKEIYGQLRKDIGEILRKLSEQKGVEIIEAEACPDHIHMLVSIPPYLSIAQFMGYLKGKSSLMIFDRHANLKYKYGSRNFWCRGYYVDTVGRNKKVIAEYIRNQLEEDYTLDQMSMKEYTDPFTGSKNSKA